ncbi:MULTISPECIES: hypothetical protein [unclassified Streptomyces]|uniref:hypothetical protein n=1 Tax=unclassified Streptomyces TaxID=2593676 RepID=UPI0036E42F79
MEPKDTTSDGPAEPLAAKEIPADAVAPPLTGETPEPAPAAEPAPAPAAPPAAPPAADPAVAAPRARRPRGRTTLLIAAAAVLGIAGGTAVGLDIQAGRAPTPLPALSQPDLAYPAKSLPAGKAPDPLPASEDRQVRTSGDLRKLIIGRPSGWRENTSLLRPSSGWLGVDNYARTYEEPSSMYEYFVESDVRRIATASWERGTYGEALITLVQFRSSYTVASADFAEGQHAYMPGTAHGAGNVGHPIKGSGNGRYYVYAVDRKPGYLPAYQARAIMQRGDIVADIYLYDTKPISKKDIRTLAERQLERL